MNFRWAVGLLVVCVRAISGSAGLTPETLKAWNEYVQGIDLHREASQFLWIDQDPPRAARARQGEILADSAIGANDPQVVPYGLIHHWVGAVFVPGVTLAQVFAVVDDYDRYSEYYSPTVTASALLCRNGEGERYCLRYTRKVLFVAEVLDTEYQVRHVQVDARRWYSIAQSTHLQEVRDQGEGSHGSRYLWRIYSIWRYEQRDGGVYVEQENIVLSRSIPNSLRWLVEPVIRQLSKDLTVTSLRQTRDAVDLTARALAFAGSSNKLWASIASSARGRRLRDLPERPLPCPPRPCPGGWLAHIVAMSLAALVSTPGFCRKPRSRNQSMKRYCQVPYGVSLRSVKPPVMRLPSGKGSPGWRPCRKYASR